MQNIRVNSLKTRFTPGGNIAVPNPAYCAWLASK